MSNIIPRPIVAGGKQEAPMKLEEDPVLVEIVRRLVNGCQPQRIYLFGSRARGDGDSDSDYDILVVVSDSSRPFHKRAQEAFRLLCGIDASKEVLVLTASEFERKLSVKTSLAATAAAEGIVLYAA